MINFTEWVSLTKVLLIVVNSCFRNTEDEFFFQVGNEGFSNVNSLWNVGRIIIFEYCIWARADGVEVRRDLWSLLKLVESDIILTVVKLHEPLAIKLLNNAFTVCVGFKSLINTI